MRRLLTKNYWIVAIIFFLSAIASSQAQETDSIPASTPLRDTKLYHVLFDSTLVSRTQVITSEEASVTTFKGGMTTIDLNNNRTSVELDDSNCTLWFVAIHCTGEAQYAEIDRIAKDTVQVAVYKRDRNTGSKSGMPIFDQTFDASHTCEVRLHLGGGDDYAIVRGSVESSILVRVIGDEGSDEMVDSSRVGGRLLYIIPKDAKRTYFYGEPSETNFIYSPSTVVRSISAEEDSIYKLQPFRDWGSAWRYYPRLGFTSDDGVSIGAALSLINYNFLSNPCQNIMTLKAMIATAHTRYDISYDAWFPQTLGGSFALLAQATTLERLNFFGYGNETPVDEKALANDEYLVAEHLYQVVPTYSIGVFENTILWGSAALRYIDTDPNPARDTTFIRRRHQYGVGTQLTTRLSYGIAFDSRDEARAATKGIYAGFQSSWTPEILDNQYAYTKLQADIRAYLTANIVTPITLAMRINALKLLGEHPFYESAFMGGASSLRGFYRDRFAGEASYLGSAELRIKVASLNLLVPSTIGVHLFSDAGRVYVDNDFSNTWHTSFGGGIWFAPVSSEHTIVFTIANSPEATQYYLTTGFAF